MRSSAVSAGAAGKIRAQMLHEGEVASLIFMRHGETDWNRQRRVMGDADVPLNQAGREQSRLAAEVLGHFKVGRVVSSPLLRARASAEIVAEPLGLPVEFDGGLEEVRFGRWQGLTYDEIRRDPEYQGFIADPLNNRTPGGENVLDVEKRACGVVERASGGECTLFVSHGDIIRALICNFTAVPLKEFRRIRIDNCGLSAVAVADGRVEVKFVNVLADPGRAWDPVHWSGST